MKMIELTLNTDMNAQLLAQATHQQQKWHVIGALPGEHVSCVKIKSKGHAIKAVAKEILSNPHPLRQKPVCEHFTTCSGCQYQHIPRDEQLKIKRHVLEKSLQDKGLNFPEIQEIIGQDYHYRRRARLSVKWNRSKEELLIGFREFHSRFITRMNTCHILPRAFTEHFDRLKNTLGQLSIRESIPQIEPVQHANGLAIIIRHLEPFSDADLSMMLEFMKTSQWHIFLHGNKNDIRALGESALPFTAHVALNQTKYHFNLNDFIQVNEDINNKIIEHISHTCGPHNPRLLDLFCGIGNLGLALAPQFAEVIGLELSEEMVEQAEHNAALNSITHCQFGVANLFTQTFDADYFREDDIVILDPPRSGAEHMSKILAKKRVRKIIYVSCNYETLVNDLAILTTAYQLTHLTVADMFAQTGHMEVVAVLEAIQ